MWRIQFANWLDKLVRQAMICGDFVFEHFSQAECVDAVGVQYRAVACKTCRRRALMRL
jgi:hypothetical protein